MPVIVPGEGAEMPALQASQVDSNRNSVPARELESGKC